MKYLKRILTLFAFSTLLLTACENMETVVEIEIETGDPMIVLNGLVRETDNQIELNVQRSKTVYESTDIIYLSGAKVKLQTPGKQDINLTYDSNINRFVAPFTPQTGITYTIKVEYSPFAPVTATFDIPQKPTIENLTTQTYQGEYENEQMDLIFELPDKQNIDAYQIQLTSQIRYYRKDTGEELQNNGEYSEGFQSNDQVLASGYDVSDFFDFSDSSPYYYNPVFLDDVFQNTTHAFRITIGTYSYYYYKSQKPQYQSNSKEYTTIVEEITYRIYVNSISENYYHYLTSLVLQQETSGSPFSEPVPVQNFVEGGIGIVTGIGTQVTEIVKTQEFEGETDYFYNY